MLNSWENHNCFKNIIFGTNMGWLAFLDKNWSKTIGQWPYIRVSETKFGLKFEISDLNYLHIHVHIV